MPMAYARDAMQAQGAAKTEIDPGTQQLQATVSMSFELQ
jgi:uncharacterized protein YggE